MIGFYDSSQLCIVFAVVLEFFSVINTDRFTSFPPLFRGRDLLGTAAKCSLGNDKQRSSIITHTDTGFLGQSVCDISPKKQFRNRELGRLLRCTTFLR